MLVAVRKPQRDPTEQHVLTDEEVRRYRAGAAWADRLSVAAWLIGEPVALFAVACEQYLLRATGHDE